MEGQIPASQGTQLGKNFKRGVLQVQRLCNRKELRDREREQERRSVGLCRCEKTVETGRECPCRGKLKLCLFLLLCLPKRSFIELSDVYQCTGSRGWEESRHGILAIVRKCNAKWCAGKVDRECWELGTSGLCPRILWGDHVLRDTQLSDKHPSQQRWEFFPLTREREGVSWVNRKAQGKTGTALFFTPRCWTHPCLLAPGPRWENHFLDPSNHKSSLCSHSGVRASTSKDAFTPLNIICWKTGKISVGIS